jgi:DNA-binding response OmpR family regulator
VLIASDGDRRLERAAKERIAAAILDAVAERLDGAR